MRARVTAQSTSTTSRCCMNRRIRNRTYGGVGGRGRQLPLLPDWGHVPSVRVPLRIGNSVLGIRWVSPCVQADATTEVGGCVQADVPLHILETLAVSAAKRPPRVPSFPGSAPCLETPQNGIKRWCETTLSVHRVCIRGHSWVPGGGRSGGRKSAARWLRPHQ